MQNSLKSLFSFSTSAVYYAVLCVGDDVGGQTWWILEHRERRTICRVKLGDHFIFLLIFFYLFFFLVPNHLETSPFSDSVMLDFYPADFPGGSGEMSDIPFIPALIRLTSEIIINLCHKPANDPVADSSQQ